MKNVKNIFLVMLALMVAMPVFAQIQQETRSNAVKAKKSKLSFMEIQSAVKETLDSMVDAYTGKNARQFMSRVSEDFTGDDMLLDRKIRRDFGKFADMDMRYTVNNITTDSDNKNVSASVTFTRSYTDIKTTKRINKTGSASFTFRIVDGRAKLASMRGPVMFGIGK